MVVDAIVENAAEVLDLTCRQSSAASLSVHDRLGGAGPSRAADHHAVKQRLKSFAEPSSDLAPAAVLSGQDAPSAVEECRGGLGPIADGTRSGRKRASESASTTFQ